MSVLALKKLFKDVQLYADFSSKHMNIGMPAFFRSHELQHKKFMEAIKARDLDAAKKAAGAYADVMIRDAKKLPKELGEIPGNLKDRNSLKEIRESLANDPDMAKKLADKYAGKVFDHYTDPTKALSIAKTAYKSAIAEYQQYAEDNGGVTDQVKGEIVDQLLAKINGNVTVNGHQITREEIMAYIEDVKK